MADYSNLLSKSFRTLFHNQYKTIECKNLNINVIKNDIYTTNENIGI